MRQVDWRNSHDIAKALYARGAYATLSVGQFATLAGKSDDEQDRLAIAMLERQLAKDATPLLVYLTPVERQFLGW